MDFTALENLVNLEVVAILHLSSYETFRKLLMFPSFLMRQAPFTKSKALLYLVFEKVMCQSLSCVSRNHLGLSFVSGTQKKLI